MFDYSLNLGAKPTKPTDTRIYGVAIGVVEGNIDSTSEARVQVSLPWLPGVRPFARVSTLMAGLMHGSYFLPQPGQEVLLAFNQGDVREPFIIGCLWNTIDRPPGVLPTDPVTKRILRTPLGHELEFDEAKQSITITTSTKQTIAMDPTGVTISTTGGGAKVTLGTLGNVSVEAATTLTLKGSVVRIEGEAVQVQGTVMQLGGGLTCDITAATVKIN